MNEPIYDFQHQIQEALAEINEMRGARIDGVDFYLVDLRGAKYDPKQAEHFRRCDAILFSRAT